MVGYLKRPTPDAQRLPPNAQSLLRQRLALGFRHKFETDESDYIYKCNDAGGHAKACRFVVGICKVGGELAQSEGRGGRQNTRAVVAEAHTGGPQPRRKELREIDRIRREWRERADTHRKGERVG